MKSEENTCLIVLDTARSTANTTMSKQSVVSMSLYCTFHFLLLDKKPFETEVREDVFTTVRSRSARVKHSLSVTNIYMCYSLLWNRVADMWESLIRGAVNTGICINKSLLTISRTTCLIPGICIKLLLTISRTTCPIPGVCINHFWQWAGRVVLFREFVLISFDSEQDELSYFGNLY